MTAKILDLRLLATAVFIYTANALVTLLQPTYPNKDEYTANQNRVYTTILRYHITKFVVLTAASGLNNWLVLQDVSVESEW